MPKVRPLYRALALPLSLSFLACVYLTMCWDQAVLKRPTGSMSRGELYEERRVCTAFIRGEIRAPHSSVIEWVMEYS